MNPNAVDNKALIEEVRLNKGSIGALVNQFRSAAVRAPAGLARDNLIDVTNLLHSAADMAGAALQNLQHTQREQHPR